MAATVTNRFILKFATNLGGVARISIPRADATKSASDMEDSMQALVDSGIMVTGQGLPVMVNGASLVTTTRTPIVGS